MSLVSNIYNPRAPDIRKIIKKHLAIMRYVAKEILRVHINVVNTNLKELLAPSNPYKSETKEDGSGCFKCAAKRCDCCNV